MPDPWVQQPQGQMPWVNPALRPGFPQQGQANQQVQQYRQAFQTPTSGARPQVPTAPAQQAPGIQANSIWNEADLQRQVNAQKAQQEQALQARLKALNASAAARGQGDSAAMGEERNRLWAQTQANMMSQENQLRFNTAQARAQHQLATEQAGSDQYFKQLQDEMSRRQLGLQGWVSEQDIGLREGQMGMQMAEAEAARQQQVGMSALGHAQDVYRQGFAQQSEMDRLMQTLNTQREMQQAGFGFQGGQNALERELQERMQGAGFAFQGGQNEAERILKQQMQGSDIASQEKRLGMQLGSQEGMQTKALTSQEGQNALQRQLEQALQSQRIGSAEQQAAFGREHEAGMQGRQIASTEQMSAAENALRERLLGTQLGSDMQRQLASQQFQSGENLANRQLQQQLQTEDIAGQMARLGLSTDTQKALQTQALTSQEGQSALQRQLEQALQSQRLGSQEGMQAKDIAAQQGRLGMQIGSTEKLAGQDIAAQQQRLGMTLGAQAAEGAAGRQLQAGLQTQQLGFQGQQNAFNRQQQMAMQANDLTAQMQRLQNQLIQEERQGIRNSNTQWSLANLQNQRDLVINAMQGAQGMQLERLRQTGAERLQEGNIQQQQWAQALGTAADFEKLRIQTQQEERMSRLNQALQQQAFMERAPVDYAMQSGLQQWRDFGQLQQIQEQSRQQQMGQYLDFARRFPLEAQKMNMERYRAQTDRMQYMPEYQNMRAYQTALSGIMPGVGQRFAAGDPMAGPASLSNAMQMLDFMFNYRQNPPTFMNMAGGRLDDNAQGGGLDWLRQAWGFPAGGAPAVPGGIW